MYDYMKALQKRFDHQEHSELDKQVEYAQEELRRDMDAAGRGKLLRLLDAQNTLPVFVSPFSPPVPPDGRCVLLPPARRNRAHLPPALLPCPTPA